MMAMANSWPAQKRFKGVGGKAIGKGGGGGGCTGSYSEAVLASGEVRFDDPASANLAYQKLNGSILSGYTISLSFDPMSKDMTKLFVSGLPPNIEWQELKDHFAGIGSVAFAHVRGAKRHGPKLKGEVRFETPQGAAQALAQLQGTMILDSMISIEQDPHSKDGTKLVVSGLSSGTGWQEVKDHFAQIGHPIAFASVSTGSPDVTNVGEVRYDDPEHARAAMTTLNGSLLDGSTIFIQTSPGSQDGCKLMVLGLSPRTQWQELKDHFAKVGSVAFAEVANMPKPFGGGGFGQMAPMMMMGNMGNMGGMGMMNNNWGNSVVMMNGGFMGSNMLAKLFNRKGGKGGGKRKGANDPECWDMKAKGFCPRAPNCKWCSGSS